MTNIAEQTLASIVTFNNNAVQILEKHDLDYCCKGKRTLSVACEEKGLPLDRIILELEQGMSKVNHHLPFEAMNAEQLISYILLHHHFYVKQSMPTILAHIEKVTEKHGTHYPYMTEVLSIFKEINEEMTQHMQKEEKILFPRIIELEALTGTDQKKDLPGGYITGPVGIMEAEHDHAGELLYKIRELTNSYTPPADACTTFKVTLAELKEFEEDLHRHVHLENNLLFPIAERMEYLSGTQEKFSSCSL
ncbi:MAG TPA: iron-sulfur cluster repair di-iron protein [Ferruginibacter sp.]|nr:iron-sulfur cluster repair di-iron protein [Ferruginibacter sp.]